MKLTVEGVMSHELVRAFALRLEARDKFGRDSEEYRDANRTVKQINAALIAYQSRRVEEHEEVAA